jgi:hypothetical protein
LDNFEHEHAYLDEVWKKWSLGAKDEKWHGDYLDVEDGVLISWLKMDQKMDTWSSQNGVWKFGKRTIYNCRAHIATSFVPAVRVIGREIFKGYLEILGE